MNHRFTFTVHVYADELDQLHALRASAGLPTIDDETMVRFVVSAGIDAEMHSYRTLTAEKAA